MAKEVKIQEYTQEQIEAYNRGWAKFMVQIFQEQIERLHISDSGSLMRSIDELTTTGTVTTIEHKFLMYGIYVAAGVGNGFYHGNGGELLFMNTQGQMSNNRYGSHRGEGGGMTRADFGYGKKQVGSGVSESHMLSPKFESKTVEHGKNKGKRAAITSGQPRQRRDWVMKKYYYSLQRLNETNNKFYGLAYQGMTSDFLDALFAGISDSKRTIRSNRF